MYLENWIVSPRPCSDQINIFPDKLFKFSNTENLNTYIFYFSYSTLDYSYSIHSYNHQQLIELMIDYELFQNH